VRPTTKRKLRSTRTSTEESVKRVRSSTSGKDSTTTPTARLADLGGVEGCVEKMLELVAMPLCHPEVYLHTGVQPPRGVLLHGPPGCGKTLLANAIAGVCIADSCRAIILRSCTGIGCSIHQCVRTLDCIRDVRRIGKDSARNFRRGKGDSQTLRACSSANICFM
jgi:AAA+ superfamily predicted ATPase